MDELFKDFEKDLEDLRRILGEIKGHLDSIGTGIQVAEKRLNDLEKR